MPKTITLDWDEYQRLVRDARLGSVGHPQSEGTNGSAYTGPSMEKGLLLVGALLKQLGGRARIDWVEEMRDPQVVWYTPLSGAMGELYIRSRSGVSLF